VVWDRLTPDSVTDPDRPDWRADSLAFETLANGKEAVAVAREDGSGIALEPAPGSANEGAPRWVAPGLLLDSSDFTGFPELWYREVPSGVTRRLTDVNGALTPAPRPLHPGVCYVASGGRLTLLPDTAASPLDPIPLTPASLVASEPDWNPAGDQICFSAAGPNGTSQIWRLSLTDTLAVQLTVGASVDRSPRWSPDGARILFASNRGGRWGIWTVSPQGEAQGLGLIAQDLVGAEIRHPAWSPDGTRVILSSDRSGVRALWRLSSLP
jgi:WD40 repeat protein